MKELGHTDRDSQLHFVDIPQETSWTQFVSMLIHRATCPDCIADGGAEVFLTVMIDGKPHKARVCLELAKVQ